MFLDTLIMILVTPLFSIWYIILFPYFSIPNFVFSSKLVSAFKAHKKLKRFRLAPLAFPVAGILFYLTIDMFELSNMYLVWFSILGVISLAPVVIYFLLRNRKL